MSRMKDHAAAAFCLVYIVVNNLLDFNVILLSCGCHTKVKLFL